jgi:fructoselysine and glucoselysine-specific PTS system IIA component
MKIILVSHGKLALGMKDTLQLIVGPRDDVIAFEAYEDGKGDKFIDQIKKLVSENVDEKFVVITDVLGGSVNNEMTSLLKKNKNVYLITGMNLPLVITLATKTGEVNSELIDSVVKEGQKGVININQMMNEAAREDSDEL